MREFEITGFVNYPRHSENIKRVDTGKTFVYLIAIDYDSGEFSKLNLDIRGDYVGDDVTPRRHIDTTKLSVDEIVSVMRYENGDDDPFEGLKPLISSVLIGWSSYSYQINDDIQPWICSFRELTTEGRKLYYSFKKLHNEKEVRLITINNIQK